MSVTPIKVLVVDDNEKTRHRLIEQLRFEDVEVSGESILGAAAFTWAEHLDVDVVLVSIEEPVARALRTVESLAVGARTWPVIGLSSLGDREAMRKAMVAGVRDYLPTSAPAEEIRRAIVSVHEVETTRRTALTRGEAPTRLGTIVTVFGVKGGIGKSTVSSNMAVSLAQETKQHVAMLDLDLQFGDAAVMLDIVPSQTIEDAAKEVDRMDPQLISGYLEDHPSRLRLLAAPPTPEGAEGISPEQVGQVLEALASTNDYVVVDTSAQFDPATVVALDLSTIVLLVVVPEVPCIRRTKAALTLMQEWGYSQDKLKLVINRSRKKAEVSIEEIEQVLQYPIYAQIPEDREVAKSISIGTPVAMSGPKTKSGRAILEMGRTLAGLPEPKKRLGLFPKRGSKAGGNGYFPPTAPMPAAPAMPRPQAAPSGAPMQTLDSLPTLAHLEEPDPVPAPAPYVQPAPSPVAYVSWPEPTERSEPAERNPRNERDYWGNLLGLTNLTPHGETAGATHAPSHSSSAGLPLTMSPNGADD
ncbi:MAG: AAA family ATPase [Chloroflexota bacterium]|nr:AAA family ATPase [Chloroflexota bacterium]